MPNYEGIFPAIVTPMNTDGSINEIAFREVVELILTGKGIYDKIYDKMHKQIYKA